MSKLIARKQYKSDGSTFINAYQLVLKKISTEKSGFKDKDELNIKYLENKIIIEKRSQNE